MVRILANATPMLSCHMIPCFTLIHIPNTIYFFFSPPPGVLFTSEQRALLNDALGYFDEAVKEASAKEGENDPIAAAR